MSQKGRWARTDVCRRASFLWITEPDRLPVKVPCHESRGLGTAPQAQASVAEPVQHGMHGWTGDVQSIDCSLPTSDHEDEPSETSGLHSVVRSHERHKIRRDTSDPRGAPLEAGAARVARRIRACGKSPSPPRSAVLAPATPRAPLLPAAGLLPWSRPCLTSCRPSRCVTSKEPEPALA